MSGAFDDTVFCREVRRDVEGAREGGAIFIVDAEDGRKGVGKTSCAVALAKHFATRYGYEMTDDDVVLGGEAYLKRLKAHPGTEQPSCVVWDEAVGAGSGDARRAMAEQNRVLGQAWQTLRTKRILQFVTLPTWNELDVRLRRLADYRVWCQARPIGTFKPYRIGLPFDGGGLQTTALGPNGNVETIDFPNLDAADEPLYHELTKQKDDLIQADTFDADQALADGGEEEVDDTPDPDEIRDEEQIKTVVRAVRPWDDEKGMSRRQAAKLVDYSYGWVRDRVEEWDDGAHRDLVEDGAALTQ